MNRIIYKVSCGDSSGESHSFYYMDRSHAMWTKNNLSRWRDVINDRLKPPVTIGDLNVAKKLRLALYREIYDPLMINNHRTPIKIAYVKLEKIKLIGTISKAIERWV